MIGCLLTLFFGLIISVIINAVQKHRVLKINSSKASNNMDMNTDSNLSKERKISSTISTTTVDLKPTAAIVDHGHVNHAIRLDDE